MESQATAVPISHQSLYSIGAIFIDLSLLYRFYLLIYFYFISRRSNLVQYLFPTYQMQTRTFLDVVRDINGMNMEWGFFFHVLNLNALLFLLFLKVLSIYLRDRE